MIISIKCILDQTYNTYFNVLGEFKYSNKLNYYSGWIRHFSKNNEPKIELILNFDSKRKKNIDLNLYISELQRVFSCYNISIEKKNKTGVFIDQNKNIIGKWKINVKSFA